MIYLDLDNTLIDTEQIRRWEAHIAGRYGISVMTYFECADLVWIRDRTFSFEHVYDELHEYYPDLPQTIIGDLYRLLAIPRFMSGAPYFLERFRKQDLILVTSGDAEFQRIKIKTHSIEPYVREIHINNDKTKVITLESPPVFFVDDAPRHIEAVGRAHPSVICIRVHEPPSWEVQQDTLHPHIYVESLFGAMQYIERSQK
jgi:beta-phosphoglucomutase-like phosphatase (HAD superfamily)